MQIDSGHEAVLFLSVKATGLPSVTCQNWIWNPETSFLWHVGLATYPVDMEQVAIFQGCLTWYFHHKSEGPHGISLELGVCSGDHSGTLGEGQL